MNIIAIEGIPHLKGALFTLGVEGRRVEVVFSAHALDRMATWRLPPEIVGETLLDTDGVPVGHHGRFIAHKCYGQPMTRVVYGYDNRLPVVITVYSPHKVQYF